jgi:glycosyltransferase involved in cell wall biosynthesis
MVKVSAIILTYNESLHIKGAIESVLWCDEIIVVDSFSTDNTQEIIRSFPQVRLVEHAFETHAAQKNWIIPQATHDWIFLLDADERPTPELVQEIQQMLKNNSMNKDAYWIGRKNTFMDKELKVVWKNDAVIRFFKKTCRYEDKKVHEEIICTDPGRLKNKILHDTYSGRGFIYHLQKGDKYSTLSAHDYKDRVGKITLYHLALRPFMAFIKSYILKGGFIDGKQGFIIAVLTGWNIFCRFVKVWRMREGEKF